MNGIHYHLADIVRTNGKTKFLTCVTRHLDTVKLACLHEKQEVHGSNPHLGKNFCLQILLNLEITF